MEKGIKDLFQQKLYRPIDNFNLEYCQNKNKVFLYSKLNELDTSEAHLSKIENVEKIIEEIKTKISNPSICVLPEGPQTIPFKS